MPPRRRDRSRGAPRNKGPEVSPLTYIVRHTVKRIERGQTVSKLYLLARADVARKTERWKVQR